MSQEETKEEMESSTENPSSTLAENNTNKDMPSNEEETQPKELEEIPMDTAGRTAATNLIWYY